MILTTKPIRVLHLINGRFYGGGQRVVLDLLRSLPEAGDFQLRLCRLGESADSPLLQHSDITVCYDGRYNRPVTLLRAARGLRRVISELEPDILHTHGLDADLIGGLAVAGKSTRHLSHLHITPPVIRKESWKANIRRRLFHYLTKRNNARFIAVSEAVREQMAEYYRLPRDRITTIRNGVALSEFTVDHAELIAEATANALESRGVTFGAAGRLAPMKGFGYLIEAASHLKRQGANFCVLIAGTGGEQRRLEDMIAKFGLENHVRLLGHVADMQKFYSSADVFVLPSVSTEGLPLVVLEAMAAGKPVLATNLAGTPEVIRDGVDGILVEPGNAEALSKAMTNMIGDPENRLVMAETGKQRVAKDFCIERVAKDVAQLYRSLASGKGSA